MNIGKDMVQGAALLLVTIVLVGCGPSDEKKKELELKEREIAIREKELALKEKGQGNDVRTGARGTGGAQEGPPGAKGTPPEPASKASPPLLTRERAVERAVKLLMGNPYGTSAAEVRGRIVSADLSESGDNPTCPKRKPVWVFHVVVPAKGASDRIDGYLILDAMDGSLACAGLPFLD